MNIGNKIKKDYKFDLKLYVITLYIKIQISNAKININITIIASTIVERIINSSLIF